MITVTGVEDIPGLRLGLVEVQGIRIEAATDDLRAHCETVLLYPPGTGGSRGTSGEGFARVPSAVFVPCSTFGTW